MSLPKTTLGRIGLLGLLVVVLAFEFLASGKPLLFHLVGLLVLVTVYLGLLGAAVKLTKAKSGERAP
ncbi:MAG: hypothetical protein ABSC22_13890 [Roseiarcus sp.]|jgi:hypothetical protein